MIALSMSSPPKCVSPLILSTSTLRAYKLRIVTSKVPPPKSKMQHFLFVESLISMPKARAAAVGSLMIAMQVKPAIFAALIVDYF